MAMKGAREIYELQRTGSGGKIQPASWQSLERKRCMPVTNVISEIKKDFIYNLLIKGERIDGRSF